MGFWEILSEEYAVDDNYIVIDDFLSVVFRLSLDDEWLSI